jgi:AraC family transcriptional regulator of adaptative response/methylated-DNA-[protein]-cysteine methyltransferase
MGTTFENHNGYSVGIGPIGTAIVGYRKGRLLSVLLGDNEEQVTRQLRQLFPDLVAHGKCEDLYGVADRLASFPDGSACLSEVPVILSGSLFQIAVFLAIREIPIGRTVSYSLIARKIGRPKAVRAVASACAANPLAIVVPCHRVARSDGKVSGFAWGVDRKRLILGLEQTHTAMATIPSGSDNPH